jgi:TolB-like protein
MKPQRIILAALVMNLCRHDNGQAQDIDTELSKLADKLAAQIKEHGKKKVTVIDFSDLQGGATELGRYIAEQLTVDLVIGKTDFSVLDRANLKSILAEHKLTATGLVDPENAKKLGMFAGVDALILGTIIPKNEKINLNAKIITTDTAEIIGAARAEFKSDEIVQQLVSHPAAEGKSKPYAGVGNTKSKATKSFGELRIDLESLKIVNGNQLLMTIFLTNQSPKKTIWIAVSAELMGNMNGRITDASGSEFHHQRGSSSGIQLATFSKYGYEANSFSPGTELKPGDSTTATLKFISADSKQPESGSYRVQLEFLVGHIFKNNAVGAVTFGNFVGEIEAE